MPLQYSTIVISRHTMYPDKSRLPFLVPTARWGACYLAPATWWAASSLHEPTWSAAVGFRGSAIATRGATKMETLEASQCFAPVVSLVGNIFLASCQASQITAIRLYETKRDGLLVWICAGGCWLQWKSTNMTEATISGSYKFLWRRGPTSSLCFNQPSWFWWGFSGRPNQKVWLWHMIMFAPLDPTYSYDTLCRESPTYDGVTLSMHLDVCLV